MTDVLPSWFYRLESERLAPPRDEFPYVYRWNRQGRKGQPCRVLAKGELNSCAVVFPDGYQMVTSRNALKRRTP